MPSNEVGRPHPSKKTIVLPSLPGVRDEEAAGSNPVTPNTDRQPVAEQIRHSVRGHNLLYREDPAQLALLGTPSGGAQPLRQRHRMHAQVRVHPAPTSPRRGAGHLDNVIPDLLEI